MSDRHSHDDDDHGGHAHEHDHHQGHDDGPGSGLWQRSAHGVSGFVGGHSHDAGEQIDTALEADAAGRRALIISFAGLAVTAAIQAVVVGLSGSIALLGDTLHNVADALTAIPLLIAFTLAKRGETKRYTYGYGRAEDLAGLFVVAMIALSSAVAAYEAVRRLIHPQTVTHLWAVAGAAVVGFVGNEIVARYRIKVGRQIGSAALVADGLHARTDGFTSLAVLIGAAGVALGWPLADPLVGLVITLAILGVLRSASPRLEAGWSVGEVEAVHDQGCAGLSAEFGFEASDRVGHQKQSGGWDVTGRLGSSRLVLYGFGELVEGEVVRSADVQGAAAHGRVGDGLDGECGDLVDGDEVDRVVAPAENERSA